MFKLLDKEQLPKLTEEEIQNQNKTCNKKLNEELNYLPRVLLRCMNQSTRCR